MQAALPSFDVDRFLASEREKDLLHFLTCGSVDDGKSTLIGRLLYDSRNVFEDQIKAVAKASENRAGLEGSLDLSLLTDGLRAEREQGITIDVAYRYFATARRKFIIADTPGHEQYTRNMATGASQADLAILLIDARHGVLPQSRRHASICALLGIRNYVVAINKMDLVSYSRDVFEKIRADFTAFLETVGIRGAHFLPMSALAGDNVVSRSSKMAWFDGPSLLEHLETVDIDKRQAETGFRMPVQRVIRPDQTFRGYAGQIASGSVRPGDEIIALPSGRRSRIEHIVTFDGDIPEAFAPQSVTLTLTHELDISRGDMLASVRDAPHSARRFEAQIVWMNPAPLDPRRRYLIKHTTQIVPAEINAPALEMNAIGRAEILTARPIFFDPYTRNRSTGAFIVIDPETNATSGAGMIIRPSDAAESSGPVTAAERFARWGHRGAIVRVGNRPDLARNLERRLFDRGCAVVVLSHADQSLADAGVIVLTLEEPGVGHHPSEIMRGLETSGVLHSKDHLTQGEGI
jgi:sulfate adenylyltransferase large subunit